MISFQTESGARYQVDKINSRFRKNAGDWVDYDDFVYRPDTNLVVINYGRCHACETIKAFEDDNMPWRKATIEVLKTEDGFWFRFGPDAEIKLEPAFGPSAWSRVRAWAEALFA